MEEDSLYFNEIAPCYNPTVQILSRKKLQKINCHYMTYEKPISRISISQPSSDNHLSSKILLNKRCVICFKFSLLLEKLFEHIGYEAHSLLASLFVPKIPSSPHHLSIVNIEYGTMSLPRTLN